MPGDMPAAVDLLDAATPTYVFGNRIASFGFLMAETMFSATR